MKDKTVKGMNSRGQCWPAPRPFYTIEINTYRARRIAAGELRQWNHGQQKSSCSGEEATDGNIRK